MKFDRKAAVEALQEVSRVAFFGAISALVSVALEKVAGFPQTEVTVIGTLVLKLVDKYINESKYIKLNGLTDTKILIK
jgi:hypothetical protein